MDVPGLTRCRSGWIAKVHGLDEQGDIRARDRVCLSVPERRKDVLVAKPLDLFVGAPFPRTSCSI